MHESPLRAGRDEGQKPVLDRVKPDSRALYEVYQRFSFGMFGAKLEIPAQPLDKSAGDGPGVVRLAAENGRETQGQGLDDGEAEREVGKLVVSHGSTPQADAAGAHPRFMAFVREMLRPIFPAGERA
jgi:hypothetical protein